MPKLLLTKATKHRLVSALSALEGRQLHCGSTYAAACSEDLISARRAFVIKPATRGEQAVKENNHPPSPTSGASSCLLSVSSKDTMVLTGSAHSAADKPEVWARVGSGRVIEGGRDSSLLLCL